MKKLNKIMLLTICLGLGLFSNLKAQSFNFNQKDVMIQLGNQFINNWDSIDKIVYSKHKEDRNLIISMHVIGEGEDLSFSPVIEIDYEKKYRGDFVFAYSFNCYKTVLKDAKKVFNNFKDANRGIDYLEKNVSFEGYGFYNDLPEQHKIIFFKMINAAENLIDLGCLPQQL